MSSLRFIVQTILLLLLTSDIAVSQTSPEPPVETSSTASPTFTLYHRYIGSLGGTVTPYSGPDAVSAPVFISVATQTPKLLSYPSSITPITESFSTHVVSLASSVQTKTPDPIETLDSVEVSESEESPEPIATTANQWSPWISGFPLKVTSDGPELLSDTVIDNGISLLDAHDLHITLSTTIEASVTMFVNPTGEDQSLVSHMSEAADASTHMPAEVGRLHSYSTTTNSSVSYPVFSTLSSHSVDSSSQTQSNPSPESMSAPVGTESDAYLTASISSTYTNTNTISSPTPLSTTPQYRGINVINHTPFRAGQYKNATEWNIAFQHVRDLPTGFNAVRLYSTTDWVPEPAPGHLVMHLRNALPEARAHNLSVHVGLWSGGDEHVARFRNEIIGLDEALAELGCDNIIAVSVGNEDIYSSHRKDTRPTPFKDIMLLVNQTQDVMHVLDRHGCCDVKVTHAETFGDWLNVSFTEPLIRQVDFLTVNIFPFWSSTGIDEAASTFWANLNETKAMAATYNKEVWLGETGWPREGKSMGPAVPTLDNMQSYWNQIGCKLMNATNAFWYTEWDTTSQGPSFGIMHPNGTSIIGDMSC